MPAESSSLLYAVIKWAAGVMLVLLSGAGIWSLLTKIVDLWGTRRSRKALARKEEAQAIEEEQKAKHSHTREEIHIADEAATLAQKALERANQAFSEAANTRLMYTDCIEDNRKMRLEREDLQMEVKQMKGALERLTQENNHLQELITQMRGKEREMEVSFAEVSRQVEELKAIVESAKYE